MALNFDPMFPETEEALLLRITVTGPRPMLRRAGVAVEDVLTLLVEGLTPEAIVRGHAGLEIDDVRACLVYARRIVGYLGAAPTIS